ncbi:MAG: hypothetical protein AAF726_09640 [Planctomycetota bacterium]
MRALRLSAVFLVVAAFAGGGGLRSLCVVALVGFAVSFLVGLDRSALVRR